MPIDTSSKNSKNIVRAEIKSEFIRELMLRLNLRAFTGRVLIKGKVPNGSFILKVHMREGIPTYCFLSIEGGTLTGGKCIEVAAEMNCINCELMLEQEEGELLQDETLVTPRVSNDYIRCSKRYTSPSANPLMQLLLLKYPNKGKVLQRSLSGDLGVKELLKK